MIVYDITDKESFDEIQNTWLDEVNRYAPSTASKVIVGNKNDLEENRVISRDDGKELASQLGYEFFETSAKTSGKLFSLFY